MVDVHWFSLICWSVICWGIGVVHGIAILIWIIQEMGSVDLQKKFREDFSTLDYLMNGDDDV